MDVPEAAAHVALITNRPRSSVLVPPYTRLARAYDDAMGMPFFIGTRLAFEHLVRRYGIEFRSAADLGCGTGLFARYLNRRWRVPVIAIDRSGAMLFEAQRACNGCDVMLLQQDIRCLRLPRAVDLVTANFDTVNHLLTTRDLCRALRAIADNLRPGGHFLFDFVTDCQPFRALRRRMWSRSTGRRVEQAIRWNGSQRLLSISVSIDSVHGGLPAREVHRERAYAPAEMARCLADAGFVLRGVHDARTLGPPARCSPRLVIVAQKPK